MRTFGAAAVATRVGFQLAYTRTARKTRVRTHARTNTRALSVVHGTLSLRSQGLRPPAVRCPRRRAAALRPLAPRPGRPETSGRAETSARPETSGPGRKLPVGSFRKLPSGRPEVSEVSGRRSGVRQRSGAPHGPLGDRTDRPLPPAMVALSGAEPHFLRRMQRRADWRAPRARAQPMRE